MNKQHDKTEPNPIYWLEMRRARRSYLPYVFLAFGCVMGLYLIAVGLIGSNNEYLVSSFWYFIPMAFWAIGPLVIPYLLLKNFSDQLRDTDDLMLRTAMTGSEILWGKMKLALVLLLWLYMPTLPGNLLCLLTTDRSIPFSCGVGFIGTLCLCAIGLGFLVGGRTVALQRTLLFLAFVFVLFTLILSYAIMEPVYDFFRNRKFFRFDYHVASFLAILTVFLFWVLSSGLAYGMGVLIANRFQRLFDVLIVALILFVLVFVTLACFPNTVIKYPEQVVPSMIALTCHACSPIIALMIVALQMRKPIHPSQQ